MHNFLNIRVTFYTGFKKYIFPIIFSLKYILEECISNSVQFLLQHFSYLISERELKFTFAISRRPSVCRPSVFCLSSVCLSSVTFVRQTQTIEIFGNVSMPFGTLTIRDLSVKILWRSSQGNPSVGGVKHKRGSQI